MTIIITNDRQTTKSAQTWLTDWKRMENHNFQFWGLLRSSPYNILNSFNGYFFILFVFLFFLHGNTVEQLRFLFSFFRLFASIFALPFIFYCNDSFFAVDLFFLSYFLLLVCVRAWAWKKTYKRWQRSCVCTFVCCVAYKSNVRRHWRLIQDSTWRR